MQEITVELPSDILLTLNETESELKQDIKFSLAIRLYQLEKVTIGKAAQIAGLTRYQFERVLNDHRIPISNISTEDVREDIQRLTR